MSTDIAHWQLSNRDRRTFENLKALNNCQLEGYDTAFRQTFQTEEFVYDQAVKDYGKSFEALGRDEDDLTHIAHLAKASIVEKVQIKRPKKLTIRK